MTDPKPKADEKEDYGVTGRTRRKPDAPPQERAAPVHRDEDNEAALADVDLTDRQRSSRNRDEERAA